MHPLRFLTPTTNNSVKIQGNQLRKSSNCRTRTPSCRSVHTKPFFIVARRNPRVKQQKPTSGFRRLRRNVAQEMLPMTSQTQLPVTPGHVRANLDNNNTRDGTTQTRQNNNTGSDFITHNLHPGRPAGDGTQTQPNTASTAVILCDSNGRFLNSKKMFPSSYTAQYFRCPKIENARALIQNEITDSPQLIVIHTGTNDIEMTHTADDLISDITTMITEASTKFPSSKIIYSTLLPRADVSSQNIAHINETICVQCSKLPNVYLVTHDNVFVKGPAVKHLRRRHIGLFAANLVEAIRGRTRPARLLSTQTRSPPRQPNGTIPGTVPLGTYASYSSAVKGFPPEMPRHQQAPYIQQAQQQVNRLYGQSPNNSINNPVHPQNRDATVEVPKGLNRLFSSDLALNYLPEWP